MAAGNKRDGQPHGQHPVRAREITATASRSMGLEAFWPTRSIRRCPPPSPSRATCISTTRNPGTLAPTSTSSVLRCMKWDTPWDWEAPTILIPSCIPITDSRTGLSDDDKTAILSLYAAQTGVVPEPLALTVDAPPATTTSATMSLSGTVTGGSGSPVVTWASSTGASGTASISGHELGHREHSAGDRGQHHHRDGHGCDRKRLPAP